jgi:hypothetical protein
MMPAGLVICRQSFARVRHDAFEMTDGCVGPDIVLNEHIEADGAVVFAQACRMGLEGIVSKRLDAPYRSGRSGDWVKTKNPESPVALRACKERW